jgi:serine/threonine protein kinase
MIALSPDSRWIAYGSQETGRSEVYVRPFPETNQGRWQISSDGAGTPRWSRDGRELFFVTLTGDLVAVPVRSTPTFAAGAPKRLLGGIGTAYLNGLTTPYYDVSPDGRRFLLMRASGRTDDTEQLIVVDNWLDEVARQAGRGRAQMTDTVPVPSRLQSALADRYRLERELGAGGMATVYLAADLKHDRKVAIKVLRPELAAVIGAERFLSEIKTTANLQHPHILPLFDSGESDGFLYYVMPFIEGETLRDRLTRDKQLTIADAVRIATEVADALEYAHKRGIVHRDIKPENVLLHDGRALVADFGIALAASKAGESRMTQTGMSLGTPAYMSPEQAMGEREITGRSDIYALGCMLYEMLSGDPPFTGSTAQAIVARVMTERPRGLVQQRHTIPPHVEAATLTAMEKLPADRFESAGAFAAALRDAGFALTGARRRAAGPLVPRRPIAGASWPWARSPRPCSRLAAAGWLRPAVAPPVSRQQVLLWQYGRAGVEPRASSAMRPRLRSRRTASSIVFVDSSDAGLALAAQTARRRPGHAPRRHGGRRVAVLLARRTVDRLPHDRWPAAQGAGGGRRVDHARDRRQQWLPDWRRGWTTARSST